MFGPDEANPKLVIHPYTVLAGAIFGQRVQLVSGRRPQIVEHYGGADHSYFTPRAFYDIGRDAFWASALRD
jgi:hypothetical protein